MNLSILTNREKASLNSDTCSSVRESACISHVVSCAVLIAYSVELGSRTTRRGDVGENCHGHTMLADTASVNKDSSSSFAVKGLGV